MIPFRVRPHPWFNIKTMTAHYGIQVSLDGGKWMNVMRDNAPLLFNTEAERNAEMNRLAAEAKDRAKEKKAA